MPPERRPSKVFPGSKPLGVQKPVKTERTHEENQERAYIAASRRSDRSLEARIESARRASEIHKKRTGRALRVTEQDVVNEEMYEEEEDDLPTQYKRLKAHLQTESYTFNRRLHAYITSNVGVRNMFYQQQFPGGTMPPLSPSYGPQPQSSGQVSLIHQSMNQSMLPPQTFNPSSFEAYNQSPPPYSPRGFQQQPQSSQQAPYSIPQHSQPQSHQRSASISTPLTVSSIESADPRTNSTATTLRGEVNRRMSLPVLNAFEQNSQQGGDAHARARLSDANTRPPLSRTTTTTTTAQDSHQQSMSPQKALIDETSASNSGHDTPQSNSEHPTWTGYPYYSSMYFNPNSQVLNTSPFSIALPPETQQFAGGALDPKDPRTAVLMAGSEHLPQPFTHGTYTYNPNLSSKSALNPAMGMTQTLAPENAIKVKSEDDETTSNSPPPPPATTTTNDMYSSFAFNELDFSSYLDPYQGTNGGCGLNEQFSEAYEENTFVDWGDQSN